MKRVLITALCIALGLGLATFLTESAIAQQPRVLKMQSTWPASLTLHEQFTYWAERVDKLSGGMLKIEAMPAGQVVPAFEVLDATHKKVIDGAHSWAGYWTGKNKASILFTGGPGGTFGMDFIDAMGWMYYGGGFELYQEFYREQLKLNLVVFPILPAGPQAFGWFKKPIESVADMKGMKCRQTGIAGEVWQSLGFTVVNMPGGEIIPSAQRGVIDCAEWVGGIEDLKLGFHTVWKYHYSPGVHENVTIGELVLNGDVWRSLKPQEQEWIKSAANEAFLIWWAKWQKQNAEALIGAAGEARRADPAHSARDPARVPQGAGTSSPRTSRRRIPFFKKVLDSQKAYASLVVPAKRFYFIPYSFVANYYFPEKR